MNNKFFKKMGLPTVVVGLSVLIAACSGGSPIWTEPVAGTQNDSSGFTGKLNVYLDASVSMKGFVDVKEPYMRDKLPIILSDLRNNLGTSTDGESYYIVIDWNEDTQPSSMKWDEFKAGIRETGRYTGKDTQLHTIMNKISEGLGADDVAMFITDGVLSMGSKFFSDPRHKNENNSNYLGELTASVKETLDGMQAKGLNFAIVRTTGNFNGNYYFACNEKSVPEYKDSIMQDRPLFYLIIGREQALEKVLASISINESESSLYQATLLASAPQPITYSLAQTQYCGGLNSIDYHATGSESADSTQLDVHIDLNSFDADNRLQLCLCLPELPTGKLITLGSTAYVDNENYFTIEPLAKSDCRDMVSADDAYWKKVGMCYKLTFKTKDEIRNATNDKSECTISIVYDNPLVNTNYSSDDDLNQSLKDMEGRTFGLAKFMEAISLSSFKNNIVNGQFSKKAALKLNIIID